MNMPDLPQVYVGRRIALPETRQLDVLAGLFERRGAEVVRCPLVSIHDAPDQEPIRQWLERFLGETPPGDLVLLTGEGVKRLHAAAERLGLADAPRFSAFCAETRRRSAAYRHIRSRYAPS